MYLGNTPLLVSMPSTIPTDTPESSNGIRIPAPIDPDKSSNVMSY